MSGRKGKWNMFKEYLLDIFFPRHVKCIFCGEELNGNDYNDTCEKCLLTLPYIKNCCLRCGEPLSADKEGICLRCTSTNYDFELARSVFEYTDKIISVVHKYKYKNQKFLSEPISNYLCDYLAKWDIKVDMVCAVPLFKKKEKERGFNQAKLLAENVAEKFDLPYVDAVLKVKDNPSQTTLSFKERQENVLDVYAINENLKKDIKDKSILLIDDIYTTGATANAIAKILKSAHAKAVYVLTFAHAIIKQEL